MYLSFCSISAANTLQNRHPYFELAVIGQYDFGINFDSLSFEEKLALCRLFQLGKFIILSSVMLDSKAYTLQRFNDEYRNQTLLHLHLEKEIEAIPHVVSTSLPINYLSRRH